VNSDGLTMSKEVSDSLKALKYLIDGVHAGSDEISLDVIFEDPESQAWGYGDLSSYHLSTTR